MKLMRLKPSERLVSIKVFLTLFIIACSTISFSQSTIVRDTLSIVNEEIQISFSVTTDLTLFEKIEVTQYSIMNSDTISVYYGEYIMEDDDPSAFLVFEIDEVGNTLNFGIGSYEASDFYSVVTIIKSSGIPEEFIIN